MVEESARTLYGAKKICFGEANGKANRTATILATEQIAYAPFRFSVVLAGGF